MTPSKPLESKPFANAIAVMTDLAAAGVRLAPDGHNLRYWSPVPLSPELRERIKTHKPELLTYLAVWNDKRALALTHEADTIAASLGAFGTDPIIAAEAERCVEAHGRQDMATLRAACFAIEGRARALAAIANNPPRGEPCEQDTKDSKDAA